jgi:hypothetical protein
MDLTKFLRQRDIIGTLCAATLSSQLVVFADLLTTSCIIPIINQNKRIENYHVRVGGNKVEIGKILISLIRFCVILIMLSVIYYHTF